ncbi:MAG: putative toxin-antitoxin system toxin component, PIN family [Burkholderiales bacterium]
MRVFLDTNVLVSAFATRGLCADLLELVLLEHDLVLGRQVIRELNRTLRSKLKLSAARAGEITDFVIEEAAQVIEAAQPAAVPADVEDARVLGEAIAAQAGLFVTGDAALLKLSAIGNMRIVSPRRFWEILHTRAP